MVAFADSPDNAALPRPQTLDQLIAELLWVWSSDPGRVMEDERKIELHIADQLEWFLCDAFTYSPVPSQSNWWSDGVFDLRIEQIGDIAFRAIGSTWWADLDVSTEWVGPFEVEFYLTSKRSLEFARQIVRFGLKDRNGNIVRSSDCLHPRVRKPNREPKDSEWALAIELTPPANT